MPYEIAKYQRGEDLLAPKELKDIHPLGMAPVVTDGNVTVAESGAIVGTDDPEAWTPAPHPSFKQSILLANTQMESSNPQNLERSITYTVRTSSLTSNRLVP